MNGLPMQAQNSTPQAPWPAALTRRRHEYCIGKRVKVRQEDSRREADGRGEGTFWEKPGEQGERAGQGCVGSKKTHPCPEEFSAGRIFV
jgi:hypothetical protein